MVRALASNNKVWETRTFKAFNDMITYCLNLKPVAGFRYAYLHLYKGAVS